MTSKEALWYLDDIAHGRKIEYDAHELKCIVEKDLEVLEIIKKKEVVVGLLKGILHSDLQTHTASYYNSHFVANYRHLTQEEFDLLKEWLENE